MPAGRTSVCRRFPAQNQLRSPHAWRRTAELSGGHRNAPARQYSALSLCFKTAKMTEASRLGRHHSGVLVLYAAFRNRSQDSPRARRSVGNTAVTESFQKNMKFNPYEVLLSRLAADLRPRVVNAAMRRLSKVIEDEISAKLTTALIEKKIVEKVTPEVVQQQLHEKLTPRVIEREVAEKLKTEAIEQQVRRRLTPEAVEQIVREKLSPEIIEQQIRERLTEKLVDEIFMSKMLPHSLSRANVYLPN